MKKIAVIAAVATMVSAPALAADLRMPVKAPPPVVAPVATWTGFYIGLNGGYSWGRARTDSLAVAVPGAVIAVPGAGSTNLNGGVFGGQIGYNWQVSNWVWGLEGDGQWSNERSTNTVFCGAQCTGTPAAGFAASFSQRIDAFGTARGRVGWLITPDVMFYGTGGLAVASFKSTFSALAAVPPLAVGFGSSVSTTRVGWTAGGGIEGMFAPHWSAKLEYLYAGYGRFNNTLAVAGPVAVSGSTRLSDNILRAGINYHF
jgi:outer membrane immunogenic protein